MNSETNRATGRRPRVCTILLVVLVLLSVAIVLALPASAGAYVYWANYNLTAGTTIGRANLDGFGTSQSFIPEVTIPTAVAVDGRHIYWTSLLAGTVGRANLDGSGADRFFIAGASSPFGVAVDAQHVYWTTTGGTEAIGRANLDGTAADESFITGASNPYGVAVDGQHVYWANAGSGSIGRANFDGSSPDQNFITVTGGPFGVAVDGSHIYWTSDSPGAIGRADLDGSSVDPSFIATGDAHPRGVAVDGEHVYWANAAASTIGRANLDGSTPDPNFIVGPAPWGLAVDSLPYATATSVACSPAAVTLPAATICTTTVTDIAGFNPPTGTVDFSASGAGSFGPPASCSLITTGGAQSTCQQTFASTAAGTGSITAAYRGDTYNATSSGTAGLTVLAAHPFGKPANSFTLSRPKRGKRDGSATLIATVPGPGTLRLTGKGIKKLTESVTHSGKVTLTIRPDSRTKRTLERTRKKKVTAIVTFTPVGGDPNTKTKPFTLGRKR
jgi:streptogramin lyase